MIDLTGDDSDDDKGKTIASAGKSTIVSERPGLMRFWDGAVRLTHNELVDLPAGQSMTFDELLGDDIAEAKTALLSSYCIEEDWLLPKLKRVPKVILVGHPEERKTNAVQFKIGSNVTMVYPAFARFPTYGVMHSKLMLIVHADRLRVVISTANLMEHDYSVVQNAFFLQDLRRCGDSVDNGSSQFYRELRLALDRFGIRDEMLSCSRELGVFDWTIVKALLISSVPGYTDVVPGQKHPVGLAQLSQLARHFKDLSGAIIEYQGSSLGGLDAGWLAAFQAAARGVRLQQTPPVERNSLKIVFPTMQSVLQSNPLLFGTIFCRQKDWESPSHPRDLLYSCQSAPKRGRPLHTKLMTVSRPADGTVAYYYLGSANFTGAAWGKMAKLATKQVVANFELGVLLDPVECPLPAFPYERPVVRYGPHDAPWMQDMLHN